MALVSMALPDDDDDSPEAPSNIYGYGLCINLNDAQAEALGFTTPPEVGAVIMLQARAVVTRTNVEDDGDGPEIRVSLQITDMSAGVAEGAKDAATVLYGSD